MVSKAGYGCQVVVVFQGDQALHDVTRGNAPGCIPGVDHQLREAYDLRVIVARMINHDHTQSYSPRLSSKHISSGRVRAEVSYGRGGC